MRLCQTAKAFVITLACASCLQPGYAGPPATSGASPPISGERHLKNVRQLTFGRQNAEA
jgi:hypothetical protein